MKKELLKGLTEEQIAKIKACKNQEEVLKLAKEEGIELNDEQLETVNGGCSSGSTVECLNCGSTNVTKTMSYDSDGYTCNDCGYCWRFRF